jgi:hypothetical protein
MKGKIIMAMRFWQRCFLFEDDHEYKYYPTKNKNAIMIDDGTIIGFHTGETPEKIEAVYGDKSRRLIDIFKQKEELAKSLKFTTVWEYKHEVEGEGHIPSNPRPITICPIDLVLHKNESIAEACDRQIKEYPQHDIELLSIFNICLEDVRHYKIKKSNKGEYAYQFMWAHRQRYPSGHYSKAVYLTIGGKLTIKQEEN